MKAVKCRNYNTLAALFDFFPSCFCFGNLGKKSCKHSINILSNYCGCVTENYCIVINIYIAAHAVAAAKTNVVIS